MDKRFYIQALFLGVSICCSACAETPSQGMAVVADAPAVLCYVPPVPPAELTDSRERANYMAGHYWDHYDFTDTTLLSNPDLCEQTFVDFLPALSAALPEESEAGIRGMLDRAIEGDSLVFRRFFDLYEQYLYHPNSPMRNEELYIPVLRWVVASDRVNELAKIRPRCQLEMVLKNRPGAVAADFSYTLASGAERCLSSVKTAFTVLFFNNPDCDECRRVKEYMAASPVIMGLVKPGIGRARLAILAIYPDEDLSLWRKGSYPDGMENGYDAGQVITKEQLYDLKAIPTLYLLDKHKQVILKDVQVEQIEAWLAQYGADTTESPVSGN